jgi:hypothetical protein
MEDASVLSSDDPGSKWRRVARFGAGACALATVLPFDNNTPLWGYFGDLLKIAVGVRDNRKSNVEEWLIVSFCCLVVPVLLGGPVYVWVCSRRSLQTDRRGVLQRVTLQILWALTAILPYIFVFKQLPPNLSENEVQIGIAVSALSLYLLICGLTYLASRRVRETPLYIFSMGTLSITMNLLAWACLMMMIVLEFPPQLMTALIVALGFSGALLLFWGWLKWWSAVKKTQTQRTAATTPQVPVLQ